MQLLTSEAIHMNEITKLLTDFETDAGNKAGAEISAEVVARVRDALNGRHVLESTELVLDSHEEMTHVTRNDT
jgi:hypothetical protein